jgi:hypothetical protein
MAALVACMAQLMLQLSLKNVPAVYRAYYVRFREGRCSQGSPAGV